jgi:hypothetical protein
LRERGGGRDRERECVCVFVWERRNGGREKVCERERMREKEMLYKEREKE